MTRTLTAAEPVAAALVLTPPQAVQKIEPERAGQMVKLAPDLLAKLDVEIDGFVASLLALDPHGDAFQNKVKAICGAGDAEASQSASMSRRMLDRPLLALASGAATDGSAVSRSLLDLRQLIEDLDPSSAGDLLQPRKLLGLIPFGSKLARYFERYTAAQGDIQRLLQALHGGRDDLERDNAAIEEEKINLSGLMQRLDRYVYVLKGLDEKLDAKALELDGSDADRARVIREEVLFHVRQKRTDLLTQTAVNMQGHLTLEMIRKTNLELLKGVQRASTTTVSALRTAVMVAQAIDNQKLVLDQIRALNTTTGRLIESTPKLLKAQTQASGDLAAGGQIEIEKLKTAFRDIYDAMDRVADFRAQALDNLGQTVEALGTALARSASGPDRAQDTLDSATQHTGGRLADRQLTPV